MRIRSVARMEPIVQVLQYAAHYSKYYSRIISAGLLLAVLAMDLHKSADAVLKAVHMRFHAAASRPDGPAAPSIFNTVLRMS